MIKKVVKAMCNLIGAHGLQQNNTPFTFLDINKNLRVKFDVFDSNNLKLLILIQLIDYKYIKLINY